MKSYRAPWSMSLTVISALVTVLCVGISVGMIWRGDGLVQWGALPPLAIVIGAALFTIRGYAVADGALQIQRLLWTTQLPLAGLQSARSEPDAMRRSLRTFGNGGLYSFSGAFRNKALGTYRAFVTDPRRTVVLRFPERTVVVSPDAPEEFVHEIGAVRCPLGG